MTKTPPAHRSIIHGDCLDVMREWPDHCIDLVYLDPPFCTQREWFSEHGSFSDRWSGALPDDAAEIAHLATKVHSPAMGAYLAFLAERLAEVRRVLSKTGSLYLHCDQTANAYIRVLLDDLFGAQNFRNEVVWKRNYSQSMWRKWAPVKDSLLYYALPGFAWNDIWLPYREGYVKGQFRHRDERGAYSPSNLVGRSGRPSSALSGKAWKGVLPIGGNGNWTIPGNLPKWFKRPDGWDDMNVHEKLDALDDAGLIHWPDKGEVPRMKQYVEQARGVKATDLFLDLDRLNSQSKERVGYPTQKPVELLARIIKASSNEGDLVLDPFCGSGTTLVAAEALRRRWVGIDAGEDAIRVATKRLREEVEDCPLLDDGPPLNTEVRPPPPEHTGELV